MPKAIKEKERMVEELKEKIEDSTLMVLADFQGVRVEELRGLRKELQGAKAKFHIVKNSLISRAMEGKNFEGLSEHLRGNTAILLGYRDPITPLKILVKFIKETEKGRIKAGIMENSFLKEQELKELAKLPPREVLLAKMVLGFQAPLYGLVMVLQGPMGKLVYLLNAIKDKIKD